MRKITILIILMILWCVVSAESVSSNQHSSYYYNSTRADSAHGYDVLNYDITLNINDLDHYIEGSVIATVEAEEYLSEISYELENLEVESILVNGISAEYNHVNGVIVIDLPGFGAGEQFTTTVVYSGNPQLSNDVYHLGMIFNTSYVFTLSDPSGCRWWFPAYDHPWDKAEVDFHVTMRDDWLVACNGIRMGIDDNGDGTKTHHWDGSSPMATHLPCISAANFVEINQEYEGLPIQNFVTPNQEANAQIDLQNLPEIIGVFSEKFGEYPFEKYGNAVVPMVTFGAMEHQTMTTLAMYMITGDLSYEPTIAHELAHQWFGNCLTPLTWADVWLSEGFATYSEAIYTEEMYGREAMLDYVFQNIQQYYLGWAGGGGHTVYDPTYNNYFNPVQYEKAASILHMLRKTVGDENFYAILQNYFQAYHNQCVITSEFQGVIESVTGGDFEQFFQQWIYEPGIPSYQYTYFIDDTSDQKEIKTFVKTTSNTGTDFYMKIPVQIADGDDYIEILVDSAPDNAFETTLVFDLNEYDDVQFDPELWLLTHAQTYHPATINNAYAADGRVIIYWSDFWEDVDVDGFNVYRSNNADGEYVILNQDLVTNSYYEDLNVENNETYYYKLSAIIETTFESELSEYYQATPIDFPFDLGILVIDETIDGNGVQGNPDDEMVDQFYENILPVGATHYDISAQGMPSLDFLSHFSTIIWHDDDIGQHLINEALNPLGCYLISGGNLVVSGWKTANEIDNFFISDFMDFDAVQIITQMDFTGVSSDSYPEMAIDFDKVSPAFQLGIPFICIFPGAENSVFSFNSYSGNNQDEICAISSDNYGRFFFLGFPLYYFQEEDAGLFLDELLEELGETETNQSELAGRTIELSAYPNPFNPATEIRFSLPEDHENIELDIYNLKGQFIKRLFSGECNRGVHTVIWNGSDQNGNKVASGLYLYKLQTEENSKIKKIMLIK